MFTDANRLGFLGASRAENVSRLIGRTERLVTSLGASQIDLKPAQEALAAAKALYAVRDFSEAAAQAKRAGALAVSLNERFNAYMASWKSVQGCMDELQAIGFPTDALEGALAAADKEVVRPVEENGAIVGDYLGARELLDRAVEEGRALLARARAASREIFLATLAVGSLWDPDTPHVATWLGERLEEMIAQATRELALGNLRLAHKLASDARTHAEEARAGAVRTQELLEEAEVVTEHVAAQGPVADRLDGRILSIREALAKGFVDAITAGVVVRRLSNDAVSFADRYSRTRQVLEHAERVYGRLQQQGFFSYEVDAALAEARRALGAGEWPKVRDSVRRASEAFIRRRCERESLAQAIADLDGRVALLEEFRLPLLPDVQEILGRAKEEFDLGQYSGANEDILLATVLMTEATRSGS